VYLYIHFSLEILLNCYLGYNVNDFTEGSSGMFFDKPDSGESGYGFDGYGSSGGGLSYLLSQVLLLLLVLFLLFFFVCNVLILLMCSFCTYTFLADLIGISFSPFVVILFQ
jgi:hypothetical protein